MFGASYSRKQFWIVLFLALVVVGVMLSLTSSKYDQMVSSIGLVVLLNTLANRIRDFGGNPWLAFLGLIPFFGLGLFLFFGVKERKFGSDTSTSHSDHETTDSRAGIIEAAELRPAINDEKTERDEEPDTVLPFETQVEIEEVNYFQAMPQDEQREILVELTKGADWLKIQKCQALNAANNYLVKKELGVLSEYLEEDEIVYGFGAGVMSQQETSNAFDFGTNTLLLVITNLRFMILDHALLTTSVDLNSVWLSNVKGVSASQGLMLGKIMIDTGGVPIVFDNCLKDDVKKISTIANKLIRESQKPAEVVKTQPQSSSSQVRELFELFQAGAITEEEFTAFKKKLLG